jgi:hypothetical protein
MMGQIYRQAAHVLVCLGQQDDDAEYSFSVICQLWDYYFSTNAPTSADQRLSTSGFESLPGMDSGRFSQSLMALNCRSYFERVWVVQELLLARAATLCCGHHELPVYYPHTELILKAAVAYKVHVCTYIPKPQRRSRERYWENNGALDIHWAELGKTAKLQDVRMLRLLRQRWQLSERGQKARLLDALKLVAPLQCQKPIDRLYGTLGLINWGEAEPIKPDYSKPEYDVATECILRMHAQNQPASVIECDNVRQILKNMGAEVWESSWRPEEHKIDGDPNYKMFVFGPGLQELRIGIYMSGASLSYRLKQYQAIVGDKGTFREIEYTDTPPTSGETYQMTRSSPEPDWILFSSPHQGIVVRPCTGNETTFDIVTQTRLHQHDGYRLDYSRRREKGKFVVFFVLKDFVRFQTASSKTVDYATSDKFFDFHPNSDDSYVCRINRDKVDTSPFGLWTKSRKKPVSTGGRIP